MSETSDISPVLKEVGDIILNLLRLCRSSRQVFEDMLGPCDEGDCDCIIHGLAAGISITEAWIANVEVTA